MSNHSGFGKLRKVFTTQHSVTVVSTTAANPHSVLIYCASVLIITAEIHVCQPIIVLRTQGFFIIFTLRWVKKCVSDLNPHHRYFEFYRIELCACLSMILHQLFILLLGQECAVIDHNFCCPILPKY